MRQLKENYDWYYHNMIFAAELENIMDEFYKNNQCSEGSKQAFRNMMDTYRKLNTKNVLQERRCAQQVLELKF